MKVQTVLASLFFALMLFYAQMLSAQNTSFATDGHFIGGSESLSIDLMQLGEYGRLTLKTEGFGDMRYGRCRTNFKRDAKGVVHHTPLRSDGTARCPKVLQFTLTAQDSGLFSLTFSEGGELADHSFSLFPRLRPMERSFQDKPPKNFDIIGLEPGMSRHAIEEILTNEGYAKNRLWSMRRGIPDNHSQSLDVWSKGESEEEPSRPEDTISITYSSLYPDAPEESALYIGRTWALSFYDQPQRPLLLETLDQKYGATTSGLLTRFYDKGGSLQPQAVLPFCEATIHLTRAPLEIVQEGFRQLKDIPSACGSWAEITLQEAPKRAGYIDELMIGLYRSDLIYADYWRTWSRFEAENLRSDYLEQLEDMDRVPRL